jgi:hypothetical protein
LRAMRGVLTRSVIGLNSCSLPALHPRCDADFPPAGRWQMPSLCRSVTYCRQAGGHADGIL